MFTLHSIKLLGGAAPLIKCVRGHNLAINATEENNITAGSIYGRFNSILSQDSTLTFESHAVEQITTLCNLLGLPIGITITPTPTYSAAELYFACYDEFGREKAATNHIKITINRGLLHWTTISANTNQDATISCTLIILDPDAGGALPLVIATNATLPTVPAADDERFSLGPVSLATKSAGCLQSLSINLNQTVEYLRCSSDVFPKSLRATPIKPTLTLSTQKTNMFSTGEIPYAGLALAHADTTIYLRKRLNNQVGFELPAATEHLEFTVAGIARVASHTSTVSEPGVVSLNISTIDDGTNAPLVITPNSALP
jgi:hypothetical protein